MQVKLLLVNFYLNSGLHAVFIGKPSEQMSNFWMVWFLKTESKPNFGFPHIPCNCFAKLCTKLVVSDACMSAMVACRYRDMRRETSNEIKSMWYNLGQYHIVYVNIATPAVDVGWPCGY